jgi:hypothetical protein
VLRAVRKLLQEIEIRAIRVEPGNEPAFASAVTVGDSFATPDTESRLNIGPPL